MVSSCIHISSAGHEKRHDGKHPEHYDIYCARHRVAVYEVLLESETTKPKHECRFRGEQKGKCDKTET
jgi:hypothetical protein